MISFLTVLFVISSVFLTLLILIQPGKGGGIVGSGAMGQQVFGGGGASSFIEKLTTWTAAVFMALALLLSYLNLRSGDVNLLKEASEKQAQQALIDQARKLLEQKAQQPTATPPNLAPSPAATTPPATSVAPLAPVSQPTVQQPPAASETTPTGTTTEASTTPASAVNPDQKAEPTVETSTKSQASGKKDDTSTKEAKPEDSR